MHSCCFWRSHKIFCLTANFRLTKAVCPWFTC
uniref:Uncharacterized protein n=1 Tax=Anguilla anguilla TaxID=7936 RepID=A0A0E9R652_ANGAN